MDQQELTAFEGGSVTVMCHYKYPNVTKWCRLGTTCVTDQNGLLNTTPVTIDERVPNVFSITMSEMKIESSGWYLCFKEEFQMPVHITVYELPATTTAIIATDTPSMLLTFSYFLFFFKSVIK